MKKRVKLESVMLRQYHGVEKGLSLKKPRKGFGKLLVKVFISNIKFYYFNYGYNNLVKVCCDVIYSYRIFNNDFKSKDILELTEKIDDLLSKINEYKIDEKKWWCDKNNEKRSVKNFK